MKKIIILAISIVSNFATSQTIKTQYIMPSNSRVCVERHREFKILSTSIQVYEDDSSMVQYTAKKSDEGYTDQSYYYETFSPTFYLDNYGIDAYKRLSFRYTIKITYDKKGGKALFVTMLNNDNKRIEYFLTESANYLCDEIRS